MKNKTTYITFNEPVNGVYISQVIEVAQQLNQAGLDIEIIAFFSLRDFIKNRKVLKNHFLKSHAIPSFPKLKHWKLNKIWFKILPFFSRNQVFICRGPLATNLAIDNLKNTRVIYDGRGAVWAEQKEYRVYDGSGIENELFEIEKKAVTKSHRQIAVTSELINYWKKNFNFTGDTAKVIPCTLNTTKTGAVDNIPEDLISFIDNANHQNSSITVFAGGNGKWQQLDEICKFAAKVIEKQESPVFLFLCPPDSNVQKLQEQFPKRVFNALVKPNQVHSILNKCDYGIILREQNITNKVASPVKVAEYLFAGLQVIISPNVGDYSKMIKDNNLGIIWDSKNEIPELPKPNEPEKQRNIHFAVKHLSKSAADYGTLIQP